MCIAASVVLSVTTGLAQQGAAPAGGDPIIISADSVTIRRSELEAAVKRLPADYQQYANGPGRCRSTSVDQLQLMRENLVANAQLAAMESATVVTDAELRAAFEKTAGNYDVVTASYIMVAPKGSPAAPPNSK